MTVAGHETIGSWTLSGRSQRLRVLWALCLVAVVAVQLALGVALTQDEPPHPVAGADLPTTFIELELSPDPLEGASPPAEEVIAPDPVEPPQKVEQPQPTLPEEPVETVRPDTVLPETAMAVAAESASTAPPPEPVAPLVVEPKPKPKPAKPKPSKPGKPPATQQQKAPDRSSKQPARPASQASRPAASGSAISTWQARLTAKMQRAQRFPAAARRRGEFGRVQVRVSIDPGGGIRSANVVGSSGFASLDAAALEAVRRSAPLPTPPAGTPQSKLTLVVGYNFSKS